MSKCKKRHWLAGALLFSIAMLGQARALPTFSLEMRDGELKPARIEVPSGERFKIELHNAGETPAEFESLRLRKEKVLGPGVHSFVVIAALARGKYKFFDDFHMQTGQGVIVAK